MKRKEIWVGVLSHSEEKWQPFDDAKMFNSEFEAQQWARSIKRICEKTEPLAYVSIYIGKIPTDVDYIRNEAQNGKEK